MATSTSYGLGGYSENTVLMWLYVLAIAIHGPIDITLTGLAWHLESNPIVLLIGPDSWLVVKVFIIAFASIVFLDAQRQNPDDYPMLATAWLGVLIGLGTALVIPNIVILAGVIGT